MMKPELCGQPANYLYRTMSDAEWNAVRYFELQSKKRSMHWGFIPYGSDSFGRFITRSKIVVLRYAERSVSMEHIPLGQLPWEGKYRRHATNVSYRSYEHVFDH